MNQSIMKMVTLIFLCTTLFVGAISASKAGDYIDSAEYKIDKKQSSLKLSKNFIKTLFDNSMKPQIT